MAPVSERTRLMARYGITPEELDDMAADQDGLCACCGRKPPPFKNSRRGLVIDHCHESGRVRALLCSWCNTALGQLDEDPDRVRSMLIYIYDYCRT